MNLFNYESYKSYLKDYITENKRSGLMSELALGCRCNRAYFSQMLNSKIQLTADHAVNLSEYLKFDEAEKEYFLYLVLYERSAEPAAQKSILKKIQNLREDRLSLSKSIKNKDRVEELSIDQKTLYYSTWHWSAIHVLTSTKEHQTVDALAKRLSLSKEKVKTIIDGLERMGLVKKKDSSWVHVGANLYLAPGSTDNHVNHWNWRNRALETSNNPNAIHYTTVFSLSRHDFDSLKEKLLLFIKAQRETIHSSGSEDMYAFCCDLFRPE